MRRIFATLMCMVMAWPAAVFAQADEPATAEPVQAAEPAKAAAPAKFVEPWKHEIAPYFVAAGLDGTVGIGNFTTDVDLSFNDIWDSLDVGGMLAYRASKGPYAVTVDLWYIDLEGDDTGPGGLLKANVDIQQTMAELDFNYALTDMLELIGGVRYNSFDTTIKLNGTSADSTFAFKADQEEEWVDPLIGARFTYPFNDEWSFILRGDLGGFGVGSEWAWNGNAMVRWDSSDSFSVVAGYRYLYMNYETGSDETRFEYDASESGPLVGVVFAF